MKLGTARIEDSHARFHQEVFDFADWASVSDYKTRQSLFNLIQKLIQKDFPNAQFILFGSSGASLAIQGSDIDVLVFDKTSSLD